MTDGPWQIFTLASSAGVSYRIHAGNTDIAHIPMQWSGDGSNARLIAAAPELLRLLEWCVDTLRARSPEVLGMHPEGSEAAALIASLTKGKRE